VLRPDLPQALKLLEDLLLKPKLGAAELEVIKARMRSSLERRNDRPSPIAQRKLLELLYPGSRRGHALQKADVERISRDAIRQELDRRLRAANITVALSGDFQAARKPTLRRLESILKRMPNPEKSPEREVIERRGPFEDHAAAGRILLVKYPAVQAVVVVGGYLPAHNDESFYSLQVMNHILGGGSFNSRLMREIRVKRGLAYYAYSGTSFFSRDGRFSAG